jgi:hypothetical protein
VVIPLNADEADSFYVISLQHNRKGRMYSSPALAKSQNLEAATSSASKPSDEYVPVEQDTCIYELEPKMGLTATVPASGEQRHTGLLGEDKVHITGYKLIVVMVSVALTCFLMLLDTSIIATVSSQILLL